MEGLTKKDIKKALLFFACILLAYGIFYSAYVGPWDVAYHKEAEWTRQLYQYGQEAQTRGNTIRLSLNKPRQIGRNRVVYQGLLKNRIQLRVYVLPLEPEYGYAHDIPVGKAKNDIYIGGQRFNVISCDSKKLVVEWIGTDSSASYLPSR